MGGKLEIRKVYKNVCFTLHAHDITIFNCVFFEEIVNSHHTQGSSGFGGVMTFTGCERELCSVS